jgi:sphingosine kinase
MIANLFECVIFGVFIVLVGVYFFLMKGKRSAKCFGPIPNCKWKGSRFLVICNPIGGKGEGKSIVEDVVKPLCEENGVSVDALYTQRAMHAHEIGAFHDLSGYAGVIIVSGDGLIHEFINGMASRGKSSDFARNLSSVPPIGVIPGGTCNGIARSLLSSSPQEAMIKILEGSRRMVDIYNVQSISNTNSPYRNAESDKIDVWDVHYFSWAVIADADDIIERKIRWVPKVLRETVAAVIVIAQRKLYTGSLYLTPVSMDADTLRKKKYTDPNKLPAVQTGPYAGTRLLEGKFVLLSAANMAHASYDVKLAPSAMPNDGSIDLVVMRGDVSRLHLLWMFLNLDGNHLKSKSVEIFKVSAFAFHPQNVKDSNLDVSGEWYPSSDVSVQVHPRAAPFIY